MFTLLVGSCNKIIKWTGKNNYYHYHWFPDPRLTEAEQASYINDRIAAHSLQRANRGMNIATNSSLVFNTLRVGIVQERILHSDVRVLFFDSVVADPLDFDPIEMPIDKNGRMQSWPKGFFDG